jgi:hypothetical protein
MPFSFIFEVNDDTQIISPNWPDTFVTALQSNPIAPNVGVTGPLDRNNDKIFTHSFVHRTHLEVLGLLLASLSLSLSLSLTPRADIWFFVSRFLQELVVR